MRRIVLAVAAVAMITGCSTAGATPATSGSTQSVDRATQQADAALILTMYADINAAFARSPSAGITALIATQYPGDLADVDPVRCVAALSAASVALTSPAPSRSTSGTAKPTAPALRRMTFTPRIATLAADPTFVLTSSRVKGLRPKGRVYVTDIVMTDGGRPVVRSRHQVVLDGRAYQFTSC